MSDIQPAGWLAEYTTELLNVLHVLGRLVTLEPKQADLLERVCAGQIIASADLKAALSGPPRGFCGTQQAFGESPWCLVDQKSLVHSHTLPIMS